MNPAFDYICPIHGKLPVTMLKDNLTCLECGSDIRVASDDQYINVKNNRIALDMVSMDIRLQKVEHELRRLKFGGR